MFARSSLVFFFRLFGNNIVDQKPFERDIRLEIWWTSRQVYSAVLDRRVWPTVEPQIEKEPCRYPGPGCGTTLQLFTLARFLEGAWEFAQLVYMLIWRGLMTGFLGKYCGRCRRNMEWGGHFLGPLNLCMPKARAVSQTHSGGGWPLPGLHLVTKPTTLTTPDGLLARTFCPPAWEVITLHTSRWR